MNEQAIYALTNIKTYHNFYDSTFDIWLMKRKYENVKVVKL